jgi:hypothetical protein
VPGDVGHISDSLRGPIERKTLRIRFEYEDGDGDGGYAVAAKHAGMWRSVARLPQPA